MGENRPSRGSRLKTKLAAQGEMLLGVAGLGTCMWYFVSGKPVNTESMIALCSIVPASFYSIFRGIRNLESLQSGN